MKKRNNTESILKKRSVADIVVGLICMLYAAELQPSSRMLFWVVVGFVVTILGIVELVICKVQEDEESMIVR